MASSSSKKRHASSSSISVTDQLRQEKRQRVPSTCEWILHEPAYKSWRSWDDTLPSTLWIHGPAGAGKSFLARFIAEDLQQNEEKSVVVSYYCDATSTPTSMVRSALSQLGTNRPHSDELKIRVETELELMGRSSSPATPPSDSSYRSWDRFVEIIESAPPVTIIVDGLDELAPKYLAKQEFNMAGRLVDLTGVPACCVRLLVLSRPEPNIRNAMTDNALEAIITEQKTRDDLERFVKFKISQLSALTALDDSVKAQLVAELARRAEGIFLWASIALEHLANGPLDEQSQILQRINDIPSALDEIYTSLLSKQAETLSNTELALRDSVLAWCCVAIRPLRTLEMANIIAVERLQFLPDPAGAISDVCGSLVRIEDGLVLPMHHSLREFMCAPRSGESNTLAPKFHHAAAKALLSYLSHPALCGLNNIADDGKFEEAHALAEYASLYWVYHCSQAEPSVDLQEQILAFFQSKNAPIWFDVLLTRMIHRSVLPVPPRPPLNARFCHLMLLKSQISSYFGKDRKKVIDADISLCMRSAYGRAVDEAATTHGSRSTNRLQRLLELAELSSWLTPDCQDQVVGLLTEAVDLVSELPSSPQATELRSTAYQALADEYKRRAKFSEACPLLEKIITDTATSAHRKMFALDSLGWVKSRLGQHEDARAYLEQALAIAQAEHGSTSPFTLRSKVTLAEVLSKLGHHQEAEELCMALEAQVKNHAHEGVPVPKDSMSHLNTLASVYTQQGKYGDAKRVWEIVVDDRRGIFGENHRLTIWAEMQLGVVMDLAGEKKEAREFLRDLQPRQVAVLGDKHPDIGKVKEIIEKE